MICDLYHKLNVAVCLNYNAGYEKINHTQSIKLLRYVKNHFSIIDAFYGKLLK